MPSPIVSKVSATESLGISIEPWEGNKSGLWDCIVSFGYAGKSLAVVLTTGVSGVIDGISGVLAAYIVSLSAGWRSGRDMSTLRLIVSLLLEDTNIEPSAATPSLDLYCSRPENGVLTPVPIDTVLSDVCDLLIFSLYWSLAFWKSSLLL